jgi:hypothetical protein
LAAASQNPIIVFSKEITNTRNNPHSIMVEACPLSFKELMPSSAILSQAPGLPNQAESNQIKPNQGEST